MDYCKSEGEADLACGGPFVEMKYGLNVHRDLLSRTASYIL